MIPLCERTVIAGKYRLERELASGGMGAVWVGRHLQLDAPVAVKFMSPALPQLADARARFAREARAAAKVRGPHVVQVLDHGIDGDVPYIVMELLEGEHLGDRLKRERRLSLRAAASVGAQVGKALGRAHKAGIVHRDLKPANVFLARLDDEEMVKILDFGIHKVLSAGGDDMTGTDVLMGSPQYMSPEQARGARTVDHRADLFSLGAILFRCVTGTAAFDGVTAVDVIVQICTGPTPVATRAAPDLPPEIDAFFHRALARDPDRRFASAREMTEAFTALVQRVESGAPPGAEIPDENSSEDFLTFVMDRRPTEAPRTVPAAGASADEIDAFVERAFGAIVSSRSPASVPRPGIRTEEASPASTGAGSDSIPPTTRCAPMRALVPAAHAEPARQACAPPLTRPALARLSPGSFGDQGVPSPPAQESGLRRRDPRVVPEPRVTVATLIDEGFTALRRGETDMARRAWTAALGMDPGNRTLALNLRRLEARATR